ncbi:MAG TPA: SGNH/GDSL hydrolase family protein [Thermoanaerobaculia bacterium]|jgi:lysophospholipase L1-like esterase|nr:SGNH/GDSL hydrolase family protein [Thermoanaerobaculia bacterium]
MLKKLVLTFVALAISLLAAELMLRLVGAAPKIYPIERGRFRLARNPKIGYEPAPVDYRGDAKASAKAGTQGGAHGEEHLAFYDYLGASNRLGFRDVDHEVAKPPGVYRIVVIGDSIAAGLKVDRFEDTFPAILSERLNARGVKTEVISLAVSGYNTQQEVETLREKGLRYRPDLVILSYSLSSREHIDGDIYKTLLEEEQQHGGVSSARTDPYLVGSALYRFFRYRVFPPHHGPADPKRVEQFLADVSTDRVAEYFGVLDELSKKNGFQVLVAVFPRFTKNFHAYPLGDQHAYAKRLADQHHFHYLDLIDPFQACRDASPEPIEVDNFHPNARGHRCAAEAMAGKILAEVRPGG